MTRLASQQGQITLRSVDQRLVEEIRPVSSMDPATRERLRALGYAE